MPPTAIADPKVWVAIDTAYAAPVLNANGDVVQKTPSCAHNKNMAKLLLEGARLANLFNEMFK